MKSFVFGLLLVACSGAEQTGTTCVAKDYARDCSAGGVVVFDGTPGHGVMNSCVVECPLGDSCTFDTPGGHVDGVCE